jgi:hypothetical protein
MNKRRMMLGLLVLGAVAGTVLAQFGGQPAPGSGPGAGAEGISPIVPSHLEQALSRTNAVVTRGYTEIGGIQGDDGSELKVLAIEATSDMGKAYGIAIRLTPRVRRVVPPAESFVDEDQIDSLASAMDALGKLERGNGKLANVEGRFRTPGGLELVNVDNQGARLGSLRIIQVAWSTGQVVDAGTTFRPQRFDELQRLIASAKEKIQGAK